ncbi:MAG: gamma-glutamyl-gamma-aminobutyrate hydrolase family protein [Clostridia bacterium]|nr:gamma-glutamyl-gamma-aminobutyrate hydrolase family protein [Clostridia bacterium]
MKRTFLLLLAFLLLLSPIAVFANERPVIGVAWRSDDMEANYFFWEYILWKAGASAVPLAPVCLDGLDAPMDGMLDLPSAKRVRQNSWRFSNVQSVMDGVDAVFFSGGEDISPTLLEVPQPSLNNGEPYCAARDVSDYLLMSYCLDNDIPLLAVCRGMQMLTVVSGGSLIQDLGNACAANGLLYNDTHRMPETVSGRDHARHDVKVTDPSSHLGRIVAAEGLAKVASWHHQAVTRLENTPLKATGIHSANGLTVIEAVERTDQTFAIGVQFHPEVTCRRVLVDLADDPCDYDTCLRFFEELANQAACADD